MEQKERRAAVRGEDKRDRETQDLQGMQSQVQGSIQESADTVLHEEVCVEVLGEGGEVAQEGDSERELPMVRDAVFDFDSDEEVLYEAM